MAKQFQTVEQSPHLAAVLAEQACHRCEKLHSLNYPFTCLCTLTGQEPVTLPTASGSAGFPVGGADMQRKGSGGGLACSRVWCDTCVWLAGVLSY